MNLYYRRFSVETRPERLSVGVHLVRWLFAITIFLSAFLLFIVEPMVAKQLLPALGGSSAVWTTCLVFFQTVLLLGYLYAHWISSRLSPIRQADVHALLLLFALLMLGVRIRPHTLAVTYHPAVTVFWLLTAVIGVPYFVLCSTTPLLTAWYARSFPGESPYRLFALSNFASLLALAAYPVLVEPNLTMHRQISLWTPAFFVFAVLCGGIAWAGRAHRELPEASPHGEASATSVPGKARQAMWFFLPLGGGMMLAAVTNHLSQNIAAIPLLWLPPLALYLLSFVLTFQSDRWYQRPFMVRLAVLAIASMGYALLDIRRLLPISVSLPLFFFGLFVLCFFLHGELYARRPPPEGLTRFYLFTAAGGAAGTMLIGVAAPLIFSANYDLACTLALVAAVALAAAWEEGWGPRMIWAAATLGVLFVAHSQIRQYHDDAVALQRNFYGTLRVRESNLPPQSDTNRQLMNGTIDHGAEWFAPAFRDQPLTYYAPYSGIGLALRLCCSGPKRVAVIGLGTGTIAAYGEPGDLVRFYEINPLVERFARHWFTYLRDSKAKTDVVLGDARVSMAAEPPQHYDVIAVDAFSGDAVPIHLLTAQALAIYRKHLQPAGIIAFHISNRFVNLEPVVAGIARDAGLDAVAIDTHADEENGFYTTDWVLVTANQNFLNKPEMAGAIPLRRKPDMATWTDNYSSILPVLKWQFPRDSASR